MEYFIDTEFISFDYSDEREANDKPPYRICLYDKYGHYESDTYLSQEQVDDLIKGFEKYKNFKK